MIEGLPDQAGGPIIEVESGRTSEGICKDYQPGLPIGNW